VADWRRRRRWWRMWRPRFSLGLFNANGWVNQVKHVDFGQIGSSPRKPSQQYLMVNFWSNPGQRHSQTLVKPLMSKKLSRNFVVFSEFHLNTSNSPKIKVDHFLKGHNFHVRWHFKFEVESGVKLSQRLHTLFTGIEKTCILACNLCKICWEKHHRAFVEVVEGSDLYKFPYYHLVHFSSNLGGAWSIVVHRICYAPERASAHDVTSGTPRRQPPYAHAEAGRQPVVRALHRVSLCVTRASPLVGAT
jgi:hypothetical protein